jgi:hypothetical protein
MIRIDVRFLFFIVQRGHRLEEELCMADRRRLHGEQPRTICSETL